MEEKKGTTTTVETTMATEKALKGVYADAKKASYDKKAKAYTSKATIGIKTFLSSNGLSLIVGNVYVGIKPNEKGLCEFKAWNKQYNSYEDEDATCKANTSKAAYEAACNLLKAKYSIQDKSYGFIVKLAQAGKPLMNKKELASISATKSTKATTKSKDVA